MIKMKDFPRKKDHMGQHMVRPNQMYKWSSEKLLFWPLWAYLQVGIAADNGITHLKKRQ